MVNEVVNNRQKLECDRWCRNFIIYRIPLKLPGNKGNKKKEELNNGPKSSWWQVSANHWIVRKKRTPSMVNEVVNNRQNWNAIDDVVTSSSIASPLSFQGTKKNEKKGELNNGPRAADDKSQWTAGLLKDTTPSIVDEAINNQHNWNVIDIEHSIPIASQKEEKGPRKLRAAINSGYSRTKRDDSRNIYKEGTTIDWTVPRVAGIKSHDNHWNHRRCPWRKGQKVNKDGRQKRICGMLLTKAYAARQSMNWNVSNSKRRHHEQRTERQGSSSIPQDYRKTIKRQEAKKSRCRCDEGSEDMIEKGN